MPSGNTLFANRTTISGLSGSVAWDLVGLNWWEAGNTGEAGEPSQWPGYTPSSSTWLGYFGLWFTWTAPSDTVVQFATNNPNGFWSLLSVWTGTAVDALSPVAYGHVNSGGAYKARVTFEAQAGVTYLIKVGAWSTSTTNGTGTLDWLTGTPPANDDFADAILLAGASGSTTGDVTAATSEVGEPTLPMYSLDGTNSVWWKWVCPTSGVAEFDFAGSATDVIAALFHGTTLANLELVGTNDHPITYPGPTYGDDALIRAKVVAGETYYLKVVGSGSAWGTFALAWSTAAAVIGNDHYEDAAVITGASGTISGTLTGASTELGEPWLYAPGSPEVELDSLDANFDYGGFSVWSSWTCPADGVYEFNTNGSDGYTLLGVFHDEASIDDLDYRRGRANAYGGADYRSRVTIRAEVGEVYKITVQGDYGDASAFTLNWLSIVPPVNDDLANAIELDPMGGSLTGDLTGATWEDGEMHPIEVSWMGAGRSVWYKLNVGEVGWPRFHFVADGTLGDYGEDIVVSLYTGPAGATSASQLTQMADPDDGYPVYDYGTDIELPWGSFPPAQTGWIYVQVDSYSGVYGTFEMDWTLVGSSRELHKSGPTFTGTVLFAGLMDLDVTDRHLDVDITYSVNATDQGIAINVDYYTDAALQLADPGTPGTNDQPAQWGGADVPPIMRLAGESNQNDYYGIVETRYYDFEAPGDTTGTSHRITVRIPLPEKDGLIGVTVRSHPNTMYVTDYHFTFPDDVAPPANNDAANAIEIGDGDGSSGEFVITPEAWAGATMQDGEPFMMTQSFYYPYDRGRYAMRGRTLWYKWTPQDDSEVLYFWADMDQDGGYDGFAYTAFSTVEDTWLYSLFMARRTEIWPFEIDTTPPDPFDPFSSYDFLRTILGGDDYRYNERWLGPRALCEYVAVPARHDLANRRDGDPVWIRVDLTTTMAVPNRDWRFGWFVHREGNTQFGPDDLGIFSVGWYAGNDNDHWYQVGRAHNDQYIRTIDPSWTCVAGQMSPSFEIPHPYTETELVGGTEEWEGDSYRVTEQGDVDDDGVVYLPAETRTPDGTSYDVLVWEDGFLSQPVEGRFRDAFIAAGQGGVFGPDTPNYLMYGAMPYFARLVGDELWAFFGYYGDPIVRCSLDGAFLGTVVPPPGFIDWEYLVHVYGSRRRKFLMTGSGSIPGLETFASYYTDRGDGGPGGVWFDPTGSRMYVTTTGGAAYDLAHVHEFHLSTPWRVATASYYATLEVWLAGRHPLPGNGAWDDDGTTLFLGGTYIDAVSIYTMSTPYDISTATFNGWTNIGVDYGSSVIFRPDGLRMYEASIGGVRQYTLTTPWAVGTAFVTGSAGLTAHDIFITPDGTEMAILRTQGAYLDIYALAAPWDITTRGASPESSYYVGNVDTGPAGVYQDPNTGRYYIAGQANDSVFEVVPSSGGVPTPTLSVYDAVTGLLSPTGIQGSSAGFQSWRDGVLSTRGGSATVFAAPSVGATPTQDEFGDGWDIQSTLDGSVAVGHTRYSDVTINVSWTGAFPGGIVLRYVDPNNYLLCARDGLYEVVDGVKRLVNAYGSGFQFGSSSVMTVRDWNSGIAVSSSGGTQRLSVTWGKFRDRGRANWGLAYGVYAGPGGSLSQYANLSVVQSGGPITVTVWGGDWETPGGEVVLIEDWNIVAEILRHEEQGGHGISPWFDSYSQHVFDVYVGEDGVTMYFVRWWEAYGANARDGKFYGELTGNWIVTSVYAFDLETFTYIGHVGEYDVFPSFGNGQFYSSVYPYIVVTGPIDSGARRQARFAGLDARVEKPTPDGVTASKRGPAPTPRRKKLDGPDSRLATEPTGTRLKWVTTGRVYDGAVDPVAVAVDGPLTRVTVTLGDAGADGMTITLYRNDTEVGSYELTGSTTLTVNAAWASGQEFHFAVDASVGTTDLTVEAAWKLAAVTV